MPQKFTDRAVAYLEATLPIDGSQSVTLPLEDSPVLCPLSEGLCIAYVVDDGVAYQYVQNRHLSQDAISEAQLHEIGLHNLVGLATRRNLRAQPYQNIHAVLMGGDFEASLILLDQLWESHFQQFVSGTYAIAIPARDILAFCDGTSAAGISELGQLIDRIYATGDHPISNQIYVRHESQWLPPVI